MVWELWLEHHTFVNVLKHHRLSYTILCVNCKSQVIHRKLSTGVRISCNYVSALSENRSSLKPNRTHDDEVIGMQAFGINWWWLLRQLFHQHHKINLRTNLSEVLEETYTLFLYLEFYFPLLCVFRVYACFSYMCLVSMDVTVGTRFPGTFVTVVVSYHMNAGNRTWVL